MEKPLDPDPLIVTFFILHSDYGYYKPNMDSCVKNPMFSGPEIDVCLRGHEEKIVTEGLVFEKLCNAK